jgi:flavin reductase
MTTSTTHSNQDAPTTFKPIAASVKETASLDAQVFKTVMRKLAGTVTVISTSNDAGLHGMTATAMCSVCAEPPTILIVVNRSTRTHPHIDAKKAFAVNILSEEQLDVAELFASKSLDQFASIDFSRMDDGCPVIAEAAAYLHCSVEDQFDVGTHTIFIGRVIGAGATTEPPLVYQDAKYRRVSGN